jgi:arylformamidase
MKEKPAMDWRSLTPETLEAHYNPRIAVPDFAKKIAHLQALSAAARERMTGRYDIRFGDGPKETLDVFIGEAPGGPLHVFIHGGYWRALDKQDYSALAEPLVAAGATVVSLNYDLCPDVTLDEIVAQTRRGIAYVARNAADLGGDAERLYISGHSAGAHLCALALAHDWTSEGLPEDLIKGAVLVTGIYDPEPARHISLNSAFRLTPEIAERNNAFTHLPRPGASILVAVGGDETEGWIAQSTDFHAAVGGDAELMIVPGFDHFQITSAQTEAAHPLCQASVAQMGLA